MEKKFTPGPWKIEEDNLGCKNIIAPSYPDDTIFNVGYTSGLSNEAEDLANARLIIAAPLFVDAANDAIIEARQALGEYASVDMLYIPDNLRPYAKIIEYLSAALAKVDGE